MPYSLKNPFCILKNLGRILENTPRNLRQYRRIFEYLSGVLV
jgi:hypothetical protein